MLVWPLENDLLGIGQALIKLLSSIHKPSRDIHIEYAEKETTPQFGAIASSGIYGICKMVNFEKCEMLYGKEL